jgi:CheY-like chemotaxis protein
MVLLVEDNPGDVRLMKRAMKGFGVPHTMHVVEHGEDALAFLGGERHGGAVPPVHIVLLDWNLPRVHGRDVLKSLKSSPSFKHIPVVVLTSSADPIDIMEAYACQANCYITKPLELHDYMDTVTQLERFWFGCAELPMRRSSMTEDTRSAE